MKQRLKINGVLMFLATCLALFFPKLFLRRDSLNIFNDISEVFGFALVLLGLLLRVSARGYKSESSKEGCCLVAGGPYALVRNPMYLGILMIGMGVVLVLFKWWVNVIFILIFIARYLSLIFKEEKKLITRFGKGYLGYMKSTPRIIPGMDTLLAKDIRELLPIKLAWVKKELGSVVGFILGLLIIETWEDVLEAGFKIYLEEFTGFLLLLGLFFLLALYLRSGEAERQ